MEIKGKIISVLPIATGQGKKGVWMRQDFVLETLGQFPKKIFMSLWGKELIDKYDLEVDLEVTAFFNVESREYNGRWYTELRSYKLEWNAQQQRKWQPGNQAPETLNSGSTDDLPF